LPLKAYCCSLLSTLPGCQKAAAVLFIVAYLITGFSLLYSAMAFQTRFTSFITAHLADITIPAVMLLSAGYIIRYKNFTYETRYFNKTHSLSLKNFIK
jgi:ammonia channel protein AmtB